MADAPAKRFRFRAHAMISNPITTKTSDHSRHSAAGQMQRAVCKAGSQVLITTGFQAALLALANAGNVVEGRPVKARKSSASRSCAPSAMVS